MTDLGVLQQGSRRRAAREAQRRRARRRRRLGAAVSVLAVAVIALLALMATGAKEPNHPSPGAGTASAGRVSARRPPAKHSGYTLAPAGPAIDVHFKRGVLSSGLLFDVRTGRVLWELDPRQSLPIASLTKMMTALVVAADARATDQVLITRAAVDFSGSGVGLLPRGKRVPLTALLYGLLLPSGNDAAIALAEHVAGSEQRFIAMMNVRARAMGLRCTHFTTASGIVDQGNYSCADDLAVLAHAVLEQPLLRRIVATRSAILPFPIKGGKLYLYNNNPLLLTGYPGADGVKTGYTVASGPCLVAAARRGRDWYGVVLLHSVDPADQAQRLLNAAFARGEIRGT
jgi:serine-type D-Ala-D-Ala carboxypeptidase (penicillin-binding protein 5/6)